MEVLACHNYGRSGSIVFPMNMWQIKLQENWWLTQCHPPRRWWGGDLNPGLTSTSVGLLQNADSFTLGLAGTQNSSWLFTEWVSIHHVLYMLNFVSWKHRRRSKGSTNATNNVLFEQMVPVNGQEKSLLRVEWQSIGLLTSIWKRFKFLISVENHS